MPGCNVSLFVLSDAGVRRCSRQPDRSATWILRASHGRRDERVMGIESKHRGRREGSG